MTAGYDRVSLPFTFCRGPLLNRDKHVTYLLKCLRHLPCSLEVINRLEIAGSIHASILSL